MIWAKYVITELGFPAGLQMVRHGFYSRSKEAAGTSQDEERAGNYQRPLWASAGASHCSVTSDAGLRSQRVTAGARPPTAYLASGFLKLLPANLALLPSSSSKGSDFLTARRAALQKLCHLSGLTSRDHYWPRGDDVLAANSSSLELGDMRGWALSAHGNADNHRTRQALRTEPGAHQMEGSG